MLVIEKAARINAGQFRRTRASPAGLPRRVSDRSRIDTRALSHPRDRDDTGSGARECPPSRGRESDAWPNADERSGHGQESAQGARWRVRHMPVPIIFGHRRGLRYRYERVADRSRLFTRILIRLLGVGDLIATGNVLTVEDPHRFRKSRDAGCFVGLQPGRRNSGESETTDAHEQRGGRVSTDAAGARSELHFRTLWR